MQGVGFRPAVFRHAASAGVSGWVRNTPSGVLIEAEGDAGRVEDFLRRVRGEPPPRAQIDSFVQETITPRGEAGFAIVESDCSGDLEVGMPPDLATCTACIHELFDPRDRRYRYPFINCTDCGPRFTINRDLPYDRPRTAMASFRMCGDCAAEYRDPATRRFDAQPDACAACGPALRLIDAAGHAILGDPIEETARFLRAGRIVAVKGVGGYHLACDACDDAAVARLRERKRRPDKAFAVMFASRAQAAEHCRVSEEAARELSGAASPIVIVDRLPAARLSALISPDTTDVGAMLAYTPVHHLLLRAIGPLVMTSGNLAEEPIVSNEAELPRLLGPIADAALSHDRPIVRPCDDSVMTLQGGARLFLRRSRGFVPDAIVLPVEGPCVLACGADLKNTFCVTRGRRAFLSQHIGDLNEYASYRFLRESCDDLVRLLQVEPAVVACDLHPDYISTRFAAERHAATRVGVQHHHAHVAAVMAEHGVTGPVVGVVLDGAGYGTDGTVWGGEFLLSDLKSCRRVGHLRRYRMPGGDAAAMHPARMALSVLQAEGLLDDWAYANVLAPSLTSNDAEVLLSMLQIGLCSPWTSSGGRLFDAVAALLGFGEPMTYEAQAAIRLQALAQAGEGDCGSYAHDLGTDAEGLLDVGLGPAVAGMVSGLKRGEDRIGMARRFHRAVADAVVAVCVRLRDTERVAKVALSGGVFQNVYLNGLLRALLCEHGFEVYTHAIVPPNDACIALGQAAVALAGGGRKWS